MNRIAVLFNPSAAGGRALRRKSALESRFREAGLPYDLIVTESEDHYRRLSRDLASRYGILAAAGGDSALHILINEIMGLPDRPAVGFIGIGSSNDISREFGIESLDKACAALRTGRKRMIDLGRISSPGTSPVWFLGQANIGLGAAVSAWIEDLSRKAPHLARAQTPAGILAVMSAFRKKRVPVFLSISADGGQAVEAAFTAAVFANIRFWATGRIIAPSARPDDGFLDACLIEDVSLARLVRIARWAGRGEHADRPDIRMIAGRRFTVSSKTGFVVQADGTLIGRIGRPEAFRTIAIEAVPKAIALIS